MTQIIFEYDLEKDVENFLKAIKSKNNKKLSTLASEYVKINGENYDQELVKSFLSSYHINNFIDPELVQKKIERNWRSKEKSFFDKVEAMFSAKYHKSNIQSYLTTESRCTYNISENYFFTTIQYPEKAHWLIMHEVLHFYTWYKYKNSIYNNGVDDRGYNIIKESLTEILNLEFKNLMGNEVDRGYPQHQEMRALIKDSWQNNKDLDLVINDAINNVLCEY
jgi:hypothetical protein